MNDRHTAIVLAAKRLPQILAARDAADARFKAAEESGDEAAAAVARKEIDDYAGPLAMAQQAAAKLKNPQVLVDHAIRERAAAREAVSMSIAGAAPKDLRDRLAEKLAAAEAAVGEAEGILARKVAADERAAAEVLAAEGEEGTGAPPELIEALELALAAERVAASIGTLAERREAAAVVELARAFVDAATERAGPA